MKLSKLKLLNMPVPDFAAVQVGIGTGRGLGYTAANIIQLGMESAMKSFVKDGKLKPFHEGAMHLAARIGAFAKDRPAYLAASAVGTAGAVKAWNVLAKPFYPKAKPKLSLAQKFEKGVKRDVKKISDFVFRHPIATIAGLAAVAMLTNQGSPKEEESKK